MIDFDRFWLEGSGPEDDDDFDPDEAEVPPGVTAEEVLAWEREHGVTLPEPIRTALGIRNGGRVRNTTVSVLPLREIVPVDDDFWDHTEIEADEAPDHGLMFVFGDETGSGGTFLLNFNARGPGGSPSVYLDHHGESSYLVNESIGGLFEAGLASSADPSVAWSEAWAGLTPIARETIDLSTLYDGRPAAEDQVLGREGGALILWTRLRSPEGGALTRTTLPTPLDATLAEIRPFRPAPIATYALHLQPSESEGIIQARSETDLDGRWKNSTPRGVPIYVLFESTDRDRLEAMRAQLLGDAGAARAQARQDRQAALQETAGTLTPEQRTAAFLQAAMTLQEENRRRFAAESGDLGPVPPELAEAAAAMRSRLEQMAEMVRRRAAADPPDPETVRRIEAFLRDPDAG